jgi:mono/diheme cytochrome c family protein
VRVIRGTIGWLERRRGVPIGRSRMARRRIADEVRVRVPGVVVRVVVHDDRRARDDGAEHRRERERGEAAVSGAAHTRPPCSTAADPASTGIMRPSRRAARGASASGKSAISDRVRGISGLLLAIVALAACGGAVDTPRERRPSARSVRITMDALHRAGGVPPGWRFTPPPGDVAAGRAAFQSFRCHTCHAVRGEPFSRDARGGPDLTGMGSHHPPEYFAESIMNPDAVLVEGPGNVDADGHSTMPAYPYMTVQQVADVTAYLASLRAPAGTVDHAAMGHGEPAGTEPEPARALPAPPADAARSYFVMIYDVLPERLGEFERWFRTDGARGFLAVDGLLRIDTFVDVTRSERPLTTIFAFRDDAARRRFLDDPATAPLGDRFDAFIGPHPHRVFARPPVYRAPSLSAPGASAPAR